MEKTCDNCKHINTKINKNPCMSCLEDVGVNNYEPADPRDIELRKLVEFLDEQIKNLQIIREKLARVTE